MTNESIPMIPEERKVFDWVKNNTQMASTKDVVNDAYHIDMYITLVADKIAEAEEKLIRDWLISHGWTPPKEDHEDV